MEDYIAVLPVGAGEALILAEEIPELSLCPLEEGELPVILGWGWVGGEEAESRINALTAAMVHALPWQEEPVVFTVTSSPLYVFDSAYEGTAMSDLDGNYLTVSLPLGRYRVGRCLFEAVSPDSAPNGETQVGIYRFEPLPEI